MKVQTTVLLGLWLLTASNTWDKSKIDFGSCILGINSKIKNAVLTREACERSDPRYNKKQRKYPKNDHIVTSSEIFSKHFDIQCLSKDQKNVFESKSKLLWVDGPAGSGKTLVMLGKILQLTQQPTATGNKVLLICPFYVNSAVEEDYVTFFNNIEPNTCSVVSLLNQWDTQFADLRNCSSQIILVKTYFTSIADLVNLLCRLLESGSYHIMIDDFHIDLFGWYVARGSQDKVRSKSISDDISRLPDLISNLTDLIFENSSSSIWIFCDMAQQDAFEEFARGKNLLHDLQLLKRVFEEIKLEVNLRNTYDIANFLSAMRSCFLKLLGEWEQYCPRQEIGHYYRCTLPVFHVINDDSYDYKPILKKELISIIGNSSCFDPSHHLGLLVSDASFDCYEKLRSRQKLDIEASSVEFNKRHYQCVSATVDELLKQRKIKTRVKVRAVSACKSVEWPVVIAVIAEVKKLIPAVYIAVSRARVHCSIIIVAGNHGKRFLKELDSFPGLCKVINYPN